MTAPNLHQLTLTARADQLLAKLDHVTPHDGEGVAAVARERGWVEAARHFAARGLLTPAGVREAGKLLAATADWIAEQDADLDPPVLPPAPDIDRGPFENHAEPVVSFQAQFMANAWYKLSPQPDGTVGARYGAWCQGVGTLRHDEWTVHEDREAAVRHFVADVRGLLLSGRKLEPVQEKARDELLTTVEALLLPHPGGHRR
ncbi:MAG: hypothetical protein K2X87_14500 [Gemmataceae bacterium]|nr:hypothetical protein [Gemmataceae bacterium]